MRALAAYQGPRIAPKRLTTADLVFFGSGGSVSHVGIYVGEGRFVHAPSSGGPVRLDRLDGPYWRDHYSAAKRVLHPRGRFGPTRSEERQVGKGWVRTWRSWRSRYLSKKK